MTKPPPGRGVNSIGADSDCEGTASPCQMSASLEDGKVKFRASGSRSC